MTRIFWDGAMLNRGVMGVLRSTQKCLQILDSSEVRANRPHIEHSFSDRIEEMECMGPRRFRGRQEQQVAD